MVSRNGVNLAVYLVSSYFGDLNAKVCECLLRRGTLTLAQIIKYTELSKENVKNCLLVLIHQNCVQAFAIQLDVGFGEAPKVNTQYMALFDNIIHHMRFPKFLEIVLKELGKECEEILEGLLQHGRLSINQIIDRQKQISDRQSQINRDGDKSNQGKSTPDIVRENFQKLVHARFVERCPAPEPFLSPPAEDEASAKKKKKMALKTVEERAMEAATPMDSVRFLVETDELPEEKNEEAPESVKRTGEKRKDRLEPDAEKKEVLWRVNFEEFVRCLRHKACVENVRAQLNDEAGIVLEAMLALSRRLETKINEDTTAALSANNIYEEMIKKEGGRGMNLDRIRASLVQLGCQEAALGLDEKYTIKLKDILEASQNEEVESIVQKRHGKEAFRIFRLLMKAGRLLETDKISDSTFVEKKDTMKILYKLLNDDYVHMQKVIASGGKQAEFLLWKVNKQSLWELVLDEMYHAALNLRLRIAHELEQEKELLSIHKDKLVGEMKKRRERLSQVRLILESSLVHLDDAILLFHDF